MWDMGGHRMTPRLPLLPPYAPAVAVTDHAEDTDLLAQLHGQDHGEPARAQEGAGLHPAKHRGRAGECAAVQLAQLGCGCPTGGDGCCGRGT